MYYELLDNSVAMDKVSNVLQSVLKLCGKNPDRLPSNSTIRNINVRNMGLTHIQLSSTLTENSDMTLYTDETLKKAKKKKKKKKKNHRVSFK